MLATSWSGGPEHLHPGNGDPADYDDRQCQANFSRGTHGRRIEVDGVDVVDRAAVLRRERKRFHADAQVFIA